MSNPVFYVYGLIDPRNQLPFYIGKGRDCRANSHLKKIKAGRQTENPFKDAVILKLLEESLEPNVHYYAENMEEDAAYELEEVLIKHYGRRGKDFLGILTNVHTEGRVPKNSGRTHFKKGFIPWNKGKTGFTHSKETCQKMSEARRSRPGPRLGQTQSEDEKKKRSESMKGRQVSDQTKAKIKLSNQISWAKRKGGQL